MSTLSKLLLAMLICISPICGAADSPCKEDGFGKCYKVHARYRVYTGDGRTALWPVGTHRLLAPMSGGEAAYKLIEDDLNGYEVFGDFVVCPLAKDIRGAERPVCIQSATNLRRVKSPD